MEFRDAILGEIQWHLSRLPSIIVLEREFVRFLWITEELVLGAQRLSYYVKAKFIIGF